MSLSYAFFHVSHSFLIHVRIILLFCPSLVMFHLNLSDQVQAFSFSMPTLFMWQTSVVNAQVFVCLAAFLLIHIKTNLSRRQSGKTVTTRSWGSFKGLFLSERSVNRPGHTSLTTLCQATGIPSFLQLSHLPLQAIKSTTPSTCRSLSTTLHPACHLLFRYSRFVPYFCFLIQ